MSTSSTTAAMTTAASVASGQVLEQPGEEQQRDDREHGDDESGHLRAGAGRAVDRRLGQAAVDDHARAQPAARGWPRRGRAARGWRRSRSAPRAAYVLAAPRPSAKPTSMIAAAAAGCRRGSRRTPRPVGQAERRQPAVDLADDRDTLVGEVEQLDGDDADDDGDERARHDRRAPSQGEHDAERHRADDERPAVGVAEVA